MQVKFFKHRYLLDLERNVNEWIKQNRIEVINVSFCVDEDNKNTPYFCSILYK